MTIKDLVSTHQRVIDRRENIDVIISICENERDDMTFDKAMIHVLTKKIDELEVHAIHIPEGATNKDVFKAVFGYEPAIDDVVCNKDDWCGASEPCNYCICNPDKVGVEEDWWNAPYKII